MVLRPHDGHQLKYVNTGTWEHPAKIDQNGDLVVDWPAMEVLDVTETSAWCDDCGGPIGDDEGLSDYWQAI